MASQVEQFCLPFAGRWYVGHASDTLNVNHHMRVRAQWYGIDFLKTGGSSNRALCKSDGRTIEDFYSWNETVLSPATGEIEIAVDGMPDNPIGLQDRQNTCDNHVVIRTRNGKFAFVAHLQNGSVVVKQGDDVTAGQPVGKCGNSGNSSAPHIHLHTQDTPTFNRGNGLNMIFKNINAELTGKVIEGIDWPLIRGLFVWNGAS